MSRVKWKGPYVDFDLLKSGKKIWSRVSVIPGFLIGKTVLIHNGHTFTKVRITREKVGFKFGEFSFTRKFVQKKKIVQSKIKKK